MGKGEEEEYNVIHIHDVCRFGSSMLRPSPNDWTLWLHNDVVDIHEHRHTY